MTLAIRIAAALGAIVCAYITAGALYAIVWNGISEAMGAGIGFGVFAAMLTRKAVRG